MPQWYPDSLQQSLVRPPDWRWRRAVTLVAGGRSASRKRDDDETCRAVAFLRRQNRVVTERATRGVFRQYPDLVLAFRLNQGDPIRRLEIECRVLARQPAALIAELMQLPRHIVRTYRSMFFDVDDRLDATGYIRDVVGVTGTGPVPVNAWAMWSAYTHGPAVIDAWLDFLGHQGEEHDVTNFEGVRRDSIANFLLAQNLSLDGDAASQILKILPLIGDLPKIGEYRTAASIFQEGMTRAIDQLSWPVELTESANTDPVTCSRAYRADSCDKLKIRPGRERLRTA